MDFWQQLSVERLGVFALGGFVGLLLAVGLFYSRPSLKAVVTVIGAALGGAPVLFMSGTAEKWYYPFGLVAGFVFGALGYSIVAGRPFTQRGSEILPNGDHNVFYPKPFATNPRLSHNGKGGTKITEQRADGFKVYISLPQSDKPFKWIAKGVPKE